MKKITIKKAQNGSFDKKVISTVKVEPKLAKSDSVRAKEMSNYRNLRAMAIRGATAAKEPAPIDKAKRGEYNAERKRVNATASTYKSGGTIKKKK